MLFKSSLDTLSFQYRREESEIQFSSLCEYGAMRYEFSDIIRNLLHFVTITNNYKPLESIFSIRDSLKGVNRDQGCISTQISCDEPYLYMQKIEAEVLVTLYLPENFYQQIEKSCLMADNVKYDIYASIYAFSGFILPDLDSDLQLDRIKVIQEMEQPQKGAICSQPAFLRGDDAWSAPDPALRINIRPKSEAK